MNIAQKYMEEKLNKQKSEHDSKNHCACINGFQVMSTSVVTMMEGDSDGSHHASLNPNNVNKCSCSLFFCAIQRGTDGE